MSSLIWLLFGFAGFAMCKVVNTRGFDPILWGILVALFWAYALLLVAVLPNNGK